MGMSASQARLLELQSRESDTDFAAKFLNNQKIQLQRHAKLAINTNDKKVPDTKNSVKLETEDKAVISKEAMALCNGTAKADTKTAVKIGNNASFNAKKALYAYHKAVINAKENKIDSNITKLENEKQGIESELNSIKNTRETNIEQNYKAFSN